MDISCKHLIIAAANDCFVKCRGCYSFWGKNKEIVSTEYIINFLKKLDSQKIEKVTISGGDPLLRPDIIELLRNIKALNYKINMDTVGTCVVTNAKSLCGQSAKKINPYQLNGLVDMIGIPLDGCSDESIKTFRLGRPNIFQEQVNILNALNQTGINICINTVVHKQNMDDVAGIVDVIKNFKNVRQWQLFQYMPIGILGYKNKENFEISDEVFSKTIYNIQQQANVKIPTVKFNPKTKEQRRKLYLLIDTDGYAWTPLTVLDDEFWKRTEIKNDKRIILGNIKNIEDMNNILSFLYRGKLCKGVR